MGSGARGQEPGTRSQGPGARSQVPGAKTGQGSSTGDQRPGAMIKVTEARSQGPGAKAQGPTDRRGPTDRPTGGMEKPKNPPLIPLAKDPLGPSSGANDKCQPPKQSWAILADVGKGQNFGLTTPKPRIVFDETKLADAAFSFSKSTRKNPTQPPGCK
jgi:hypothetical protein